MQVETLLYQPEKGFIPDTFPALDSKNTLILVFCSPSIEDEQPLKALHDAYPDSTMIGCSTAGEVYGEKLLDNSMSIAIVKFDKTPIKMESCELPSDADSFKVGSDIATKLDSYDLTGIFVLSEGLSVNGSELVKGLNSLKKDIVITGGLAGDAEKFKHTFIIENGKKYPHKILAVGFYGKHIHIGHGSKGGWDIFGIERRITRSKSNVLFELDGKSALELYKQYLGDKAKELPASGLLFPLSIRRDLQDSKRLVRTILGVNEAEGSLIFAGDMPQGYLAQLMRANFDRLITGAKEASQSLLAHATKDPDLVIAVSCVGRKLLLGQRSEEETNSVLESFPSNTKMVGFYSYGEISPYTTGSCDLHNQTMTLTSLSEDYDE